MTGRTAVAQQTDVPPLFVPERQQWRATSDSRIAHDPYSWLQAVHWVAGAGIYVARRTHGPKFGPSTVRIAELCAELSPCRPGVAYLARRSGLSARAVQYHLGMLREAGLLVYAARGTRLRGVGRQASVFLWAIPPVFDAALGIRTVGEGVERRPVGISESTRTVIARLAKKAARKTRKRPRQKPSKAKASSTATPAAGEEGKVEPAPPAAAGPTTKSRRCTPMQGGCSASSSAATTRLPPEAQLAQREANLPTPKKHQEPRPLNRVGRRYQLARELTQRVPWLGRADQARVAWVARHVADAGWTATEVIAWLDLQVAPDLRYNPVGLLAHRLMSAAATWAKPKDRAKGVEAQRDSRRAERERHVGWDGGWTPPRDGAVLRRIQQTLASAPAEAGDADRITEQSALPVLEDLSRAEVAQMRQQALRDPDVIVTAMSLIGANHGADAAERYVRRLYSNHLVDQALGAARSWHMVLHGRRGWA